MKRWNRGALIAVVVGIATAIGLLNQPPARATAQTASPAIEVTYSLHTAALEVRVGVVAVEIDF